MYNEFKIFSSFDFISLSFRCTTKFWLNEDTKRKKEEEENCFFIYFEFKKINDANELRENVLFHKSAYY
jgi:hypothetical protein